MSVAQWTTTMNNMLICRRKRNRILSTCVSVWICMLFCVYIFLNDDTTGSLTHPAHVRYRHRQRLSNTVSVSGITSKSAKVSDKASRKTEHENKRLKISPVVDDPLSVPLAREYCNLPNQNSTGDEGVVPPGYQLINVQVLIRHGTRSPMYNFINHPNPRISCEFNRLVAHTYPLIKSFISTMMSNQKNQNRNSPFYEWMMFPQRKVCDVSQLMPSGAIQHILNGFHLKEKYVKKWKLFGDKFNGVQVRVISTHYSRTYQSALAFLYGLLPRFNLRELFVDRSENLYFCDEKVLKTSCSCPALRQLKKKADEDASHINKNNTKLLKLQKYIGEVYGLKRNQLPTIWMMSDVFMGYVCNKIKPPCNKNGKCINSSVIFELLDLVHDHGLKINKIKSYQDYNRVTIHPFFMNILEQMTQTIKTKSPVKISLFAGHDTTISPVAISLGFYDGKWPRLASRIVFELYSQRGRKDQHYIKVLYNGKNVTPKVTFCKGRVVDGLCKLKHFTKFVKEENLKNVAGKTYSRICHT